jgi:poly(A) polymerase
MTGGASTGTAMQTLFERARELVRRLDEAGFEAYFAGGCVRDRLLGHEPKDYDIATNAAPAAVQSLFPNTVPVGIQFGVVLVIDDGVAFEVATFRSDGVYLDGRHPATVHFGTAEADARRRDFTINGLFLDPLTERVIDYVGGQTDLHAGVVRAIGDAGERIHEDRLRMIRAAMFAARLNFVIEPETRAAIRAQAAAVTTVAWERIGQEVVKILTEGGARRGVELLAETGLLQPILPEVESLRGVAQSPDYHPEGDVLEHTLLLLEQLAPGVSESLALGALLHDVAKPACAEERNGRKTFYGHCEKGAEMAAEICHRLRRSREVRERVVYLVRNHLRLVQAPEMRLATLKRMLREEGFAELLELAHLDALASNRDMQYVEFCTAKLAEFGGEAIRPTPFLRGRDLIAMGYAPGPHFAEMLDAVEAAQLEGEVLGRDEAEQWVRKHYPLAGRDRAG